MEYFLISQSTDLKTIGKYPQLDKMFDGYNALRRYEAWDSNENQQNPMKHLKGFRLKYHAKITDWISAAQFGSDSMLISERFYNLLQNFACMASIAVESEVLYHLKAYPYRFIYFPETCNQFVDFKKSRLYLHESGWIKDLQFESAEQYRSMLQELDQYNKETRKPGENFKSIRSHETYLDESKINKDFFRFDRLVLGFFVSTRLKEAMEENRFTGIRFTPTKNLRIQEP